MDILISHTYAVPWDKVRVGVKAKNSVSFLPLGCACSTDKPRQPYCLYQQVTNMLHILQMARTSEGERQFCSVSDGGSSKKKKKEEEKKEKTLTRHILFTNVCRIAL